MVLKISELTNTEDGANVQTVETDKEISAEPKTENDLESVLKELKLFGRYHLKFFFLISLLAILSATHSVNYIFTVEHVEYRCKHSNCNATELLILENNNNSSIDYKCYNYNDTCIKNDISGASDCKEWVYDKPYSFIAEFNLACEDWKLALVGTMHNIGCMIGLLFTGPLSDKIGRKRLIIFSSVISGFFGILKSLVTSYWIFIAIETLEPLFGDYYSATFTLAIEMVTKEYRPLIILLTSINTTIGHILMATLAYFIPNWRLFLISIYGPSFCFILYIFWMDESLRWLLNKGKKTDVEEILRRAAKLNNITIEETKIVNLNCGNASENAGLWHSFKITISSRKLFTRFLVCICIWFSSLYSTYGLLINSVSLEGNKYINYGLVALSGTFSGIILVYVLTKFKRKAPLICSLALTGLFCAVQSIVPKEYKWLSIILYFCGKANSSISLRTSYLYTTELFPTYTRNTMLALCSCIGRTATILAPLTPLLVKYWSGLPSLLMGILSLLTATIVTLMPDTAEDVLPDNVTQAEAIGMKRTTSNIDT